VKTYFIDYYEVASVPLKKIYLKFYRDSLYSISCDGTSEVKDAMETKYGEPHVETEEKK